MESSIMKKTGKLWKEKNGCRRWMTAVTALVLGVTTAASPILAIPVNAAAGNPSSEMEDGIGVPDGGKIENGSMAFEADGLSEVAIGYRPEKVEVGEDGIIHILKSFEYEGEEFHITFHIEGDAVLMDGVDAVGDETDGEEGIVPASEEVVEKDSTEKETAELSAEEEGLALQTEEEALDEKLDFQVMPMNEDSEEYQAIASYTEKSAEEENALLLLEALTYSLSYEGLELDLSECKVTAEITPTETLVKSLEKSTATTAYSFDEDGETNENKIAKTGITFVAVEVVKDVSEEGAAAPGDTESMPIKKESASVNELDITTSDYSVKSKMTITSSSNNLALYGLEDSVYTGNEGFTVQYYAYIPTIVTDKNSGTLELIDTSAQNNGGNPKLPGNTREQNTIKMDLEGGKVKTDDSKPIAIYNAKTAGSLPDTETELDIKNYELTEIWVHEHTADCNNECAWLHEHSSDCYNNGELTCGIDKSTDQNEWRIYGPDKFDAENMKAGVVRRVYRPETGTYDGAVTFFDYDVTDGNENAKQQGINSPENYYVATEEPICGKEAHRHAKCEFGVWENECFYYNYGDWVQTCDKEEHVHTAGCFESGKVPPTVKLAFGNATAGAPDGTGLQNESWNDLLLNRNDYTPANPAAYTGPTYMDCTFGMVEKLSEGRLIFDGQIDVPDLFGGSSATGKTVINDFGLVFDHTGDTYTLTGVKRGEETVLSDLNSFKRASGLWTNSFWPMDYAGTFGKVDEKGFPHWPYADDGGRHNSYFGMRYEVDFELDEDYIGPLDYYFFGDDDLWVFVDGQLVCDIGGVHSSAGEYVNLRDYLGTGTSAAGTHTLSVFYTERGAHGSTCWMQFTLPGARFVPPVIPDETHDMKVSKKVNNNDVAGSGEEDSFEFEIILNDATTNKPLTKSFKYVISDEDGKKYNLTGGTANDEAIVKSGDTFRLKAGWTIEIKDLPDGTKYIIKEVDCGEYNPKITVKATDSGIDITDPDKVTVDDNNGTVTGKIEERISVNATVEFNNVTIVEEGYELPETGGTGTNAYIIAGILCIIFGVSFLYRRKISKVRV